MTTTLISDWLRGNVLGLVAILFALSGGVAWATHPGGANTISSGDIINGEVRGDDLRADAVGSGKIADGQVRNADLSIGASSSNTIEDGGIQAVDVRDDTLTGAQIGPAAIRASELANGAVNSAKVADGSLTGDDIDQPSLTGLWQLGGNKETDPDKHFLGTLDKSPLNLRVLDVRALRLEPASDGTNVSPNVIGGIADNAVTDGVFAATIGGGGRGIAGNPASANRVSDSGGTVGGGALNRAGDQAGTTGDSQYATVAGGLSNEASGPHATVGGGLAATADGVGATVGGGDQTDALADYATVAGGDGSQAQGPRATVGGGKANIANAELSTVGGGQENQAGGFAATVPGGVANAADGDRSLAAGRRAKANHAGAFVWADNQAADMASTADNQFIARASGEFFLQSDSTLDDQGGFLNTSTGGYLSTGGTWTNASDARLKRGFAAVEPRKVLRKVAELPVRTWSYEAEPGVRHIGPTAQDFHRAFGLGEDNRHIASVDADGVALAAIKGLERELRAERRARRNQKREFEARLAALERGDR
jgi:hypothetical protein